MLGLADAGDQCFPYNGAFISSRSRKKWRFPGSAGRLASGICWQSQAWTGGAVSMAWGLWPAESEGWRRLLGRAAQSLQRPRLLSHPPWEGCSSHRRFGRGSIPMLPWLNGLGRPSFPPATARDVAGSMPTPALAPFSHPLWLSNLVRGHPLPVAGGLTLPEQQHHQ